MTLAKTVHRKSLSLLPRDCLLGLHPSSTKSVVDFASFKRNLSFTESPVYEDICGDFRSGRSKVYSELSPLSDRIHVVSHSGYVCFKRCCESITGNSKKHLAGVATRVILVQNNLTSEL